MSEREAVLGEFFRHGEMHVAGEFGWTHELPRIFQRFRGVVGHRLRTGTDLPADERPREFYPVAARTGGFERIKKKVVGGDDAISWNFESCFGFAVSAGEKDVHHAWACSTGEETFHGRRHDFRFPLAPLVGRD